MTSVFTRHDAQRDAAAEIIAKISRDPVYFCETFLEEWFPTPLPWIHRGMLAVLTRRCRFLENDPDLDKIIRHFVVRQTPMDWNSRSEPIFHLDPEGRLKMVLSQFTGWMMPRGFSKTTLCNSVILYKLLLGLTKFTLYISESSHHAEMQLSNVKRELEMNEGLLKVFGSLVGPRWTNDYIETSSGVVVATRGRGGQIRGLLVNAQRPDNIVIDDVEDEESIRTEEQREKTRRFVYASVIPARSVRGSATINMLGTLLHPEAVLLTVARDPRFNFLRFSARDLDGAPIWPGQFSEERLETERLSAASAGQLAAYYREYESELRAEETQKFRNIRHAACDLREIIACGLAVDPAISDKPEADFFAIGVVGIDRAGHHWVLDAQGGRGIAPRAQVDLTFELYAKWKKALGFSPKVGVEAISYQRALVHLLREEMFRRHMYFEIEEIKHGRVGKVERVEGVLQPRYAAGYVTHAGWFPELETQLLDWPAGKKDFPDAVAMAVTLLDPWAAAAGGEMDLEQDEYGPEPLKNVAP